MFVSKWQHLKLGKGLRKLIEYLLTYGHIVMDYNSYEHEGHGLRSFRRQNLELGKPIHYEGSLQV